VRPDTAGGARRNVPLGEQLELLRLRGQIHRLELTVARQDLLAGARGLQRGANTALGFLRSLSTGGATGTVPAALGIARLILPLAGTLLFRPRPGRTGRWLRAALAALAVGALASRLLGRAKSAH
jgi:hypothetical protein